MNKDKSRIITYIVWIIIFFTLGFIMYTNDYGNNIIWYIIIVLFAILNICLLYESINYIETYDKIAIGIIGLIISGLFLLIAIAAILLIIFLVIKGVQSAN